MLIISSRNNFTDSEELISSKDDLIKDVDVQNFSFGSDIEHKEFLKQVNGKRVILLIHGYNNDIFDVMRAYAILETQITTRFLNDHYDMVLGYTWPGGDDAFEYDAAKSRTTLVAPRLTQLIRSLSPVVPFLDVMTHSMGAHVVFKAFQQQSVKIRHHFATASAIDNEAIEQGERYYHSSNACDFNFVFHSRNDGVLDYAYRIAEWDRALGYSGPEDPASTESNVKIINCKRVVEHHGGYKYSEPVFKFIQSALNRTDPRRISKFTRLAN